MADADMETAQTIRKQYLLMVCLAASAGKEGDLREACSLTEKAIVSALRAARAEEREACAKIADPSPAVEYLPLARRTWPDPEPEMLTDPVFNAIWGVIKTWDINVPDAYSGYCGATGNHARAILDAIRNPTGEPNG